MNWTSQNFFRNWYVGLNSWESGPLYKKWNHREKPLLLSLFTSHLTPETGTIKWTGKHCINSDHAAKPDVLTFSAKDTLRGDLEKKLQKWAIKLEKMDGNKFVSISAVGGCDRLIQIYIYIYIHKGVMALGALRGYVESVPIGTCLSRMILSWIEPVYFVICCNLGRYIVWLSFNCTFYVTQCLEGTYTNQTQTVFTHIVCY